MKVAINRCFGGFSLSRAGVLKGRQLSGDPGWGGPNIAGDICEGKVMTADYGYVQHEGIERHNPILIQVIESLGTEANGDCANLHVVEIPDGVDYEIAEYDGMEQMVVNSTEPFSQSSV